MGTVTWGYVMDYLETRLLHLNNKLLKLAEHQALYYNGKYSVSDIPNSNIIDILKDNNIKNRAYINGFQYTKNMETSPVEPDIIEEVISQEEVESDTIEEVESDIIEEVISQEEVEPDIIEEVIPQEEVEPISPIILSEVYTYKRKAILISEDYTATMDDYYIGVKSEDSVTITIPCDCDNGHEIVVKSEMKEPLNNRSITIISMDDENLCSIDGELEYIIELPYQSVRFVCRDNNWWII